MKKAKVLLSSIAFLAAMVAGFAFKTTQKPLGTDIGLDELLPSGTCQAITCNPAGTQACTSNALFTPNTTPRCSTPVTVNYFIKKND